MEKAGWLGRFTVILTTVCLGASISLPAARRLEMKFRVYAGVRALPAKPVETSGPPSLRISLLAHLPAPGDVEAETARILRTFNLGEADLVTEADLVIGEGGQAPDRVRLPFALNGRTYQIVLLLTDFSQPVRLFTMFMEKTSSGFESLFGETMEMKGGHSTVVGLEDGAGKPFFLTFRVTGPPEMVPQSPLPPPPPPPRLGEDESGFEEFARGAVHIDLDVLPPHLTRTVEPSLPPGTPAPAAGAHVSLYLRIDERGRVVGVLPIYSSDRSLEQPAVAAVRQWTYEPYLVDGKPRPAVIPVTVRYYSR